MNSCSRCMRPKSSRQSIWRGSWVSKHGRGEGRWVCNFGSSSFLSKRTSASSQIGHLVGTSMWSPLPLISRISYPTPLHLGHRTSLHSDRPIWSWSLRGKLRTELAVLLDGAWDRDCYWISYGTLRIWLRYLSGVRLYLTSGSGQWTIWWSLRSRWGSGVSARRLSSWQLQTT